MGDAFIGVVLRPCKMETDTALHVRTVGFRRAG